MPVTFVPCGPAANESERKAFEYLKARLQSQAGQQPWFLLGNLLFSVNHQLQADEIDCVVVGPPGVRVVEIKHWTPQWFQDNRLIVEQEAKRLSLKARKLASAIRKVVPELPRVEGVFLLTRDAPRSRQLSNRAVVGVQAFTLKDWEEVLGCSLPPQLSDPQVSRIVRLLEPRANVAIDTSLRRLAGYVDLQLLSDQGDRFLRVYRARHPERRDRVIFYLYDLSASDDPSAEHLARREFTALHRLQRFPWAPRILDSFQPVPGYSGEMWFFTVVDPDAPALEQRARDEHWTAQDRLSFALQALRALGELHAAGEEREAPILHRNLSPSTILVRHDNRPLFTGMYLARVPGEESIASRIQPENIDSPTLAPEIRSHGLSAASTASDLYSLCASLALLFEGRADDLSLQALSALTPGLAVDPAERPSREELEREFAALVGDPLPPPPAPPARFWTEEQIVPFRDRTYRIVSRLGSGGVGAAFKVVEVCPHTGLERGTYVGKVVFDPIVGQRVLQAYNLVRPHLRHTSLSTIFEVASEWKENEFLALMTWVSGSPLKDFIGVFPLLAEEEQEPDVQALALRWLRQVCEALDVLHRAGLIHGDITPRNLIVSGSDLVLIDYDFVTRIGTPIEHSGTPLYCSPSCTEGQLASPSDDLYALAATFYHLLFEREPFPSGSIDVKRQGLCWDGIDRQQYAVVAEFLDRATHPEPSRRFGSVQEALAALPTTAPPPPAPSAVVTATPTLREQRIEWLRELLQSYPGSVLGNRETRGLDSEFAARTYVETELEEVLLEDIRTLRKRLIVLCGNAGDGKTALLQHLARKLGLGEHSSAARLIEGRSDNGVIIRMNLDGSAACSGRSADEIVDEFLSPFHDGPPREPIVHVLAINDGRLLEWLDGFPLRHADRVTALTESLYRFLQSDACEEDHDYIRFVNLNQRSLVGQFRPGAGEIDTSFLHRIVDALYGGEGAAEIWSPCETCIAKDWCEVRRAGQLFGPPNMPSLASEANRRRARERLFEALQAVHFRGEVHVTTRELRAALVYILFGIHFCDDYHKGLQADMWPYWDRAFAPEAPARQGEVLTELARFDPSLDTNAKIDRYLRSRHEDASLGAPRYPELSLASARRRAFFEWQPSDFEAVGGDSHGITLARARRLPVFRDFPLLDADRQQKVCARLCRGIARLEDLPPQAFSRSQVVPLRVTPRTPTETAFWVEKPLEWFRLEPDLPLPTAGVPHLHRQLVLVYRYRDGTEERLALGAELFHVLWELADGLQLGDVSSDETFARLSIFVQRLVREEERELMAWNPMDEATVHHVSVRTEHSEQGACQRLWIEPMHSEVEK